MKTGLAIELYFDKRFDEKVRKIWRAVGSSLPSLDSAPHVSLTVLDAVEISRVESLLREFANRLQPFELKFSSIGVFPGDEAVVYLAPVVSDDLLRVHQSLHRELRSLELESLQLYRPGNWVPHCTIAQEISNVAVAGVVSKMLEPSPLETATVEEVGLIRFRPVQEICRYPLGE